MAPLLSSGNWLSLICRYVHTFYSGKHINPVFRTFHRSQLILKMKSYQSAHIMTTDHLKMGVEPIMKCLCVIYIRQWKMSSITLVSRSNNSYKPLHNRCQTHHILMPISNIYISIQCNDFCTT
jgi:hypothetical protein